jgi:hypothetical protein
MASSPLGGVQRGDHVEVIGELVMETPQRPGVVSTSAIPMLRLPSSETATRDGRRVTTPGHTHEDR